jgi:predicted  nucleic acid-binding Zn-ribbon protein
MTKQKCDTTGMKDMFEEAKRDVIERIDARIAELQLQISGLEHSNNQYDNGLGDIEDRNEINALNNEIRILEKERNEKIAELTINAR